MPRTLRIAFGWVWFQAVINALGGFLILDSLNNDLDHGISVDNAGFLRFLGYLSYAATVLLVICAIAATQRLSWVRPTVIGVEILTIINGLLSISQGAYSAIAGIAMGVFVIKELNSPHGREWFTR